MATMENYQTKTYIAGSDLSAKQFFFVSIAADGEVDSTGNGAAAAGVLLNTPTAGNPATVAYSGRVLVSAGGTITAGDNVASDAAGECVTAASTDIILGVAREDGVDGQTIAIDFFLGGNAEA